MDTTPRPKFEDFTLYDQETGEPFLFSAKDQEFFARQGYTNVPKFTPERRKMKAAAREAENPLFKVTCMICKRIGKISVEPLHPKNVLCENCFKTKWDAHLEKHPEIRALHEQVASSEPTI